MEWMTATLKENRAMRVWEEVSSAFQKTGVQGTVSPLSLPSFTLWHCSPAGMCVCVCVILHAPAELKKKSLCQKSKS